MSGVSGVGTASFKSTRDEENGLWITNREQEDIENDARDNHMTPHHRSLISQNSLPSKLECINSQLNNINEHLTVEKELVAVSCEWRIFAILLDRLFLSIYIISFFICGLTLYFKYIHNRGTIN